MEYRCIKCGKDVDKEMMGRHIRCPYCGSRVLFKRRSIVTKLKAR